MSFLKPSLTASDLPPPPPEALQASAELTRRIAQGILDDGGWWPFDQFQQALLYEPKLGYYAGGSRKFGGDGDFVTAPEISPLFARCLARQCLQWFDSLPHRIVEIGAGSGLLAAQMIEELRAAGVTDLRYDILELSGELRARQQERLSERADSSGQVAWLNRLPERIDGVVIGNELLDAMPVKLFRFSGDSIDERGVAVDTGSGDRLLSFVWRDRPAQGAMARFAQALRGQGSAFGEFGTGYVSEYGEQARGWAASVAERLGRAVVLQFDYGFPQPELYHPQRSGGTLMCHYRHRAHTDPFLWPGLQDVTSHVDFTAIAHAAHGAGAQLLGFTSQANFLMNCGLADDLRESADARDRAELGRSVQRLVSPAEMGELIKVIAFGRGLDDGHQALGFVRGDRSHLLDDSLG